MSTLVGPAAAALPLARMRTTDLLRCVEPFIDLSEEKLRELARVATRRTFVRGASIVRQGALADGLAVILRGRVHITRTLPGPRRGSRW